MKLFKRANLYRASNVQFNPETKEAYSYGWWCFVRVIEGQLVFNNYHYSSSTCKHQHKVRRLLSDLGITIDLSLPLASGLQCYDTLQDAIDAAEESLSQKFLQDRINAQEKRARKREAQLKASQSSPLAHVSSSTEAYFQANPEAVDGEPSVNEDSQSEPVQAQSSNVIKVNFGGSK